MNLSLVSVGTGLPDWTYDAFNQYAKRFAPPWQCTLQEIELAKRSKNQNIQQLIEQEKRRIQKKLHPRAIIVVCDLTGKLWSSEDWYTHFQQWSMKTSQVQIVIGGPDGLSEEILTKAHHVVSLSRMTLAHPVVRVLLAEQLYRTYSRLHHLPYHR